MRSSRKARIAHEARRSRYRFGSAPRTSSASASPTAASFAPVFWPKALGFDQGEDHPVVNVSWNDASAFCAWLAKKEGKKYRLPTEAEWEYACRAGTETAYAWGDDPARGRGWLNGADLSVKQKFELTYVFDWDDGYEFTSPVGRFKANAWGLKDMHGNVWEWVADWYEEYNDGEGKDPRGPETGSARVLRGGSWFGGPGDCRSANRFRSSPEFRYFIIGVGLRAAVDF